jgi:cellulose synthase (UDP-forming)
MDAPGHREGARPQPRYWYSRIPILGDAIEDAFYPERRPYRRFGEREDRPRRIKARVFSLLTLLSGALYLLWLSRNLNWAHPGMATTFYLAEVLCLGLFVVAMLDTWRLRFKPPEALEPEHPWSVDVFVPVCGEPMDIVRRTLEAAAGIRWHGPLTRYVLDDGNSREVEALSRELGFTYLTRGGRTGDPDVDNKAANLNFGLAHSQGELILALDADQVADPAIVEVLAGYMKFPKVAFIQSKQRFLVPEGDPFNNSDPVFYEAVQLAMDDGDTVLSCGSGVLYRRTALEDIGGFATWNLVEDLTTSYELHSKGWKSLYYPYPLTHGLAPDTIGGVYQQRSQWALDTLRLIVWDNPLFKRGLSPRGRVNYLMLGVTYLSAAFVFPFFFLVPVWTYLTGATVLTSWEGEFLFVRGAYFLFMVLGLAYMFRGHSTGKQFQLIAGLFPVYFLAAIRALLYPPGRKPAYRTNNALNPRRMLRHPLVAVAPQLVLFAANMILPFWAAWTGVAPLRVIAVTAVVSSFALWSLWPVLGAALGPDRWASHPDPYLAYRHAEELGT